MAITLLDMIAFGLQRGGGTAIYFSSKLIAPQRTDLIHPDIEATWLELSLPNRKKLLVGSIYRPPNMVCNDFKICLESILEKNIN